MSLFSLFKLNDKRRYNKNRKIYKNKDNKFISRYLTTLPYVGRLNLWITNILNRSSLSINVRVYPFSSTQNNKKKNRSKKKTWQKIQKSYTIHGEAYFTSIFHTLSKFNLIYGMLDIVLDKTNRVGCFTNSKRCTVYIKERMRLFKWNGVYREKSRKNIIWIISLAGNS